jgi:hypothetical protein
MRRLLVLVVVLLTSLVVAVPSASAAKGHGCKIGRTCKFYASSLYTARYYYRKCDPAWRTLDRAYLHGFKTRKALLRKFPGRTLNRRC